MCTEGFLCVNDAWKGILVRVSNECTFVYKCVLGEKKNYLVTKENKTKLQLTDK